MSDATLFYVMGPFILIGAMMATGIILAAVDAISRRMRR